MVRILIKKEDGYGVSLCGHANYSSYGSDIVCSAVSALVYALCSYFKKKDENAAISLKNGEVKLYVKKTDEESFGAIKLFEEGISLIALSYPENVKMEEIKDGNI